ncbi:MAG: hypothetical protein OQK07_11065 [Rhodospirillales bacterium]|nr:hypothetical protein [Rhodospirillales bacterium]
MRKFTAFFVIAIAFALAWVVPAHAQQQTQADTTGGTTSSGGVFSEQEKQVIKDYFGRKLGLEKKQEDEKAGKDDDDRKDGDRDDDEDDRKKGKKDKGAKNKHKGKDKHKGLPPGLAKRDSLPPGLARQLERNGRLPPGLDKRELPDDLKSSLPETKEGEERVIVDDSVVLIEKGTEKVLDVLTDVILGGGEAGAGQ